MIIDTFIYQPCTARTSMNFNANSPCSDHNPIQIDFYSTWPFSFRTGPDPKKKAGGYEFDSTTSQQQSKRISVANAAGTPLARRAQSHCGSYETEILIGAGATAWAFPIFFLKIWCQHVLRFIPCPHSRWLMPYLSNSAQKRSPNQKRLLFWYKLVAAVGTEILVAFSRYRSRPGDNLIRFAGVVWDGGLGPGARLSDLEQSRS